jgi:hypothetical protein
MSHTATSRRHCLQSLAALASGGWLGCVQAQPVVNQVAVGTVALTKGQVSLQRGNAEIPVREGTALMQGDQIETAQGGELHARFEDGGYLAVRSASLVRIDKYVANGDAADVAWLSLVRGALRSVTGWIGKIGSTTQQYRISVGTATVGVRGTDHEVAWVPPEQATADQPAGIHNHVHEGATTLATQQGLLAVSQGAAGHVPAPGQAPRLHERLPPFLAGTRGLNDALVVQHKRQQVGIMERNLRQRGKLGAQQRWQHFLDRHGRPLSPTSHPRLQDRHPEQTRQERLRQRQEDRQGRLNERQAHERQQQHDRDANAREKRKEQFNERREQREHREQRSHRQVDR